MENQKKIKSRIGKLIEYFKFGIWRERIDSLPKSKARIINFARVILLALRGYKEDKCQLKASALTFYSLLSMVPIVAMIFGIAKGFGIEKMLEEQLEGSFEGQEEVLNQIMTFAHNMLENTKGGMIAGIGIVILFWSVMKVLGNIEASFNDVWNIKRPRSILRKFSDYLSIMLISPVFIIISSSLNVFITSYITHAAENGEIMEYFGPALLVLVKFVPYLLIWTLLTVIYLMMPNTKVKFGSGLLAGVIAGTLFQILQWGYINFQVVLSNYNAIYGSFAALPLLLIWLRISWLIILFGAEISFAKQNVHHYEFEADSQNISPAYKRLLSLITSHLLVQNFAKGKHALTTAEISKELEIPIRIVRTILFELHEAGIISETRTESEKESAFQPAKDIHKITIQDIIEALDNNGIDSIKIKISEQKRIISESLVKFNDILKNSEANKLLMEI